MNFLLNFHLACSYIIEVKICGASPKISDVESRDGKPANITAIVPPSILLIHLKCAYNLSSSMAYSVILGTFHFIRISFLYIGSLGYETKIKTV